MIYKKEYEPFYSTKLGKLYKGDCLEIMDYLIEQNIKFDAIITDPPYAITNYKWDQIIPFDKMWERLEKLIKEDGAIVLFGNEPFSSALRKSNDKLYRYDWKWIKTQVTGFQNANYQPLRCYEDIMVFSKAGSVPNCNVKMCYYPQELIKVNLKVKRGSIDYLKEKKDNKQFERLQEYSNYPRNIIQFARESKLYHPTQKPVDLMEYIIATYTHTGELVLDFTSGSGSTLIGCESLNRKWVGIELTDKYCNVIKRRLISGIQLKLPLKESEIDKK